MAFTFDETPECIETNTGQSALKGAVRSTRYEKNADRIAMENKYTPTQTPPNSYQVDKEIVKTV